MNRDDRQALKKMREMKKKRNENPPDISGTFLSINDVKCFGLVDELSLSQYYELIGGVEKAYVLEDPIVIPKAEFYAKQHDRFVELNRQLTFNPQQELVNNLNQDTSKNLIGVWERVGWNGINMEWNLHLADNSVDNGRWIVKPLKINNENKVLEIEAIYVESGNDLQNPLQRPCVVLAKGQRKEEEEPHDHSEHDHDNDDNNDDDNNDDHEHDNDDHEHDNDDNNDDDNNDDHDHDNDENNDGNSNY